MPQLQPRTRLGKWIAASDADQRARHPDDPMLFEVPRWAFLVLIAALVAFAIAVVVIGDHAPTPVVVIASVVLMSLLIEGRVGSRGALAADPTRAKRRTDPRLRPHPVLPGTAHACSSAAPLGITQVAIAIDPGVGGHPLA